MAKVLKMKQMLKGDKSIANMVNSMFSMTPDSQDLTFIHIVRKNGDTLKERCSDFLDLLVSLNALLVRNQIYSEHLHDYTAILDTDLATIRSEDDLTYKMAYSKFKFGPTCKDLLNIAAKIRKSLSLDMAFTDYAKLCTTGSTSLFLFRDCSTKFTQSAKEREIELGCTVACNNLANLFDGGAISLKMSQGDQAKAFSYLRGLLMRGKQVLSQLQEADIDMEMLFKTLFEGLESNGQFGRHRKAIGILKSNADKFAKNYKKYMKGAITGSANPASAIIEFARDVAAEMKPSDDTDATEGISSAKNIRFLRSFIIDASKMFNHKNLSPQQAKQLKDSTASLVSFLDEFDKYDDFDDVTKMPKFDLNAEIAKLNEALTKAGSSFGAQEEQSPETGGDQTGQAE